MIPARETRNPQGDRDSPVEPAPLHERGVYGFPAWLGEDPGAEEYSSPEVEGFGLPLK